MTLFYIYHRMCYQQIWRVLVFMGCFFKCSSIVEDKEDPMLVVNLPHTATIPENSDTGTLVFTINSQTQLALVNQYPDVTSEAFVYNSRNQTITVKDGSLLDYEGIHKAFVMRFEDQPQVRRKRAVGQTEDLLLVIQLEDVKETQSFSSGSPGSSGCCDDVTTIRWMIPVCSAVELFALLVCSAVMMICFVKKINHNTVEDFRRGK